MNIPANISKDLIEKALHSRFHQKINVLGYSVESVVPVGDNYTSDLFRATVSYSKDKSDVKESMTLIIKSAPQGGVMEELAKRINLFSNEIEMFSKTLPTIHKVLGEHATLASDCLYWQTEDPELLVLDDLRPLKFVMHERQMGLDLEHCLLVMSRLAKFHAASVVMADKNPSTVQNYNLGLYPDDDMISEWVLKGFDSLVTAAFTWPGCEKYAAKIKKFGKRAFSRGVDASRRKVGGFNVLNHGDLWVNNFMFSYKDNGNLKDMRFIDFQLIKYTSPAIDLNYFVATSPKDKVREKHLDLILEYYYAHLLTNLVMLQYSLEKLPTIKEFKDDFKDRAFYGLMAAVTVAPLVKSSHRKDANFEDLMAKNEEGSFRHHCYNNDKYKNLMENLLPYYDSLGVLD